jgi:hypothetical protein
MQGVRHLNVLDPDELARVTEYGVEIAYWCSTLSRE